MDKQDRATVFAGSRAYFSNRNSFTPPSLVVQCSSLLTAAAGLIISFITHLWIGYDLNTVVHSGSHVARVS